MSMSDPNNEVTLADLLAEYDLSTLKTWIDEKEEELKVILRKTNDKPVNTGDVVYDRDGKRYYVEEIRYDESKMVCVSMCESKYRMTASCHDFGCYRKGGSLRDPRMTELGYAKQKLYDIWKD